MRKWVKWAGVIGITLCIFIVGVGVKVYSDMKTTAEKLYTPLAQEVPAEREELVDVKQQEPFSALLLGVDEREGDAGRSDTMIVLTVNPSLGTTKILSIPRDTYTEIIGADMKDKINHAFAYGGMEMSKLTVEQLLDIPIDYVAKINMKSFQEIIDIVGGITVNNELDFSYDGEHFPIGEIELDGNKALKYVRMRYEDPQGDFGRQNRQKQVIQGVLKESLSMNTIFNYKSIFETLEKNVEMNIRFDELMNVRKHYGGSFQTIEQLYLNKGTDTRMEGIYYYMPDEVELKSIQTTLQEHLEI
ncbi:LCP family protein [Lysinibacillus sp. 3P01SB]|uniref:LCP family glycopolymer transferase n=1 Tax=Lysinibacillus sp. 3P01SB TaxID=3132284 RepID=UPI0039A73057